MSEKTILITLKDDAESQISQTGFTSAYELLGVLQAAIFQIRDQSVTPVIKEEKPE